MDKQTLIKSLSAETNLGVSECVSRLQKHRWDYDKALNAWKNETPGRTAITAICGHCARSATIPMTLPIEPRQDERPNF